MKKNILEKRAYENMAAIGKKENILEVETMSEQEKQRQVELFRTRLQKEKKGERKRGGYKKWAAVLALLFFVPTSVYAATHIENVKEYFSRYYGIDNAEKLEKIHDENWGSDMDEEKEIVYEAFGVKLTIYSCYYDQNDKFFYFSYHVDTPKENYPIVDGDFGWQDTSFALAEEQKAVIIKVCGIDKKGTIHREDYCLSTLSYFDSNTKRTYMRMTLDTDCGTPVLVFTNKEGTDWSRAYDGWKTLEEKTFDFPEAEHIETKTIKAEENKNVTIHLSQQSIEYQIVCYDDEKKRYLELAKIYTTDGKVIEVGSVASQYKEYDSSVVSCHHELGGVDLSKIDKIEIGEYTFPVAVQK